jgi:hypothetical protein
LSSSPTDHAGGVTSLLTSPITTTCSLSSISSDTPWIPRETLAPPLCPPSAPPPLLPFLLVLVCKIPSHKLSREPPPPWPTLPRRSSTPRATPTCLEDVPHCLPAVDLHHVHACRILLTLVLLHVVILCSFRIAKCTTLLPERLLPPMVNRL